MKTSGFRLFQGAGRISIARFAPRNIPGGFKLYAKLAPGPWFNSVSIEEYIRRFDAEILAPLNPRIVWDELHAKVAPAEPVLLCWENLKPGTRVKEKATGRTLPEWCHRRYVAAWFERHIGVEVPELVVEYNHARPNGQLKLICQKCDAKMITTGDPAGYFCPNCG